MKVLSGVRLQKKNIRKDAIFHIGGDPQPFGHTVGGQHGKSSSFLLSNATVGHLRLAFFLVKFFWDVPFRSQIIHGMSVA